MAAPVTPRKLGPSDETPRSGASASSAPSTPKPHPVQQDVSNETSSPSTSRPTTGGNANLTLLVEKRKALMRKVAQLTKVVVHLNARNDESEVRVDRLRSSFEEEVRTITQDAALKVASHRSRFQQLLDPNALQEEAASRGQVYNRQREELAASLEGLRFTAAAKEEEIIRSGKAKLKAATGELDKLKERVQSSIQAFRQATGYNREKLAQRDAEALQAVAAEHQRRLEDLKAAQTREAQHLIAAREQALSHISRMHESELSTLHMQTLQKRRERLHRQEQDFNEERRTTEQMISHMRYEMEQQRRDVADVTEVHTGMQKQMDGMRAALDEMTQRVEHAEEDAKGAEEEALRREEEVAALQGEIAVLQVRQRATDTTSGSMAGPAGSTDAGPLGNRLPEDLRIAIAGAKRLEAELDNADEELAQLDDELTEEEKKVEILEVELEEEQLRTHQLQTRVLEREAALKR